MWLFSPVSSVLLVPVHPVKLFIGFPTGSSVKSFKSGVARQKKVFDDNAVKRTCSEQAKKQKANGKREIIDIIALCSRRRNERGGGEGA